MRANHLPLRYAGPKPFTIRERDRFFGRDQDIEELSRTIRLNRMTVLSGKSGMGKSSLLQAGVLPILTERDFLPISVRFEAWDTGKPTPLRRVIDALMTQPGSSHPVLDKIGSGDTPSLWRYCKALSSHTTVGGQSHLLLVFDQFEELATYPEADVEEFALALAHAVLNEMPEGFQAHFREARRSKALTEDEVAFVQAETPLHVVFGIRSDRMDLLSRLADQLPGVMRNCYDLGPLTENGARAAIEKTAAAEGEFASLPFLYSPEALDHILGALTRPDERGRPREIQSFLLQIICQYVEERIVMGNGDLEVQASDLGEVADIIGAFYAYQIEKISEDADQQARARAFVEEGLIFDGVRMTLNEEFVMGKYGLLPATLSALENTHLIRAEMADGGRRNYELCHDALVVPITRIRDAHAEEAERLALEIQAEMAHKRANEQTRRAHELEALNDKAKAATKRARTLARVAAVVAAISLITAAWGWWAEVKASRAKDRSNHLIKAIYFYEDRFAMALHLKQFYFIDKNGEKVKKLGEYEKAEQFDVETGLAWVKKRDTTGSLREYFLDTIGNKYLMSYYISDIDSEIVALDLSGEKFENFPHQILHNTSLNILILNREIPPSCTDSIIPAEIGQLTNLRHLHLRHWGLTSLPKEFEQLQNLQVLGLSHNQFSEIPPAIWHLKHLKTLYLDGNPIQHWPASFFELPVSNNLNYNVLVQTCATNGLYPAAHELFMGIREKPLRRNTNYGNLAWWFIFAHEFKGAIWAGERYRQQGGTQLNYLSNLAIGYLYDGQYSKAYSLYAQYKNKTDEDGRTGWAIFLEDLYQVAGKQVPPKKPADVARIRAFLAE